MSSLLCSKLRFSHLGTTRSYFAAQFLPATTTTCYTSLYYHSNRNLKMPKFRWPRFNMRKRFQNYMKNSREKKGRNAWLNEARRYAAFDKYDLEACRIHLSVNVTGYEKANLWRKFLRLCVKYFDKPGYDKQIAHIDEAKHYVKVLDLIPPQAFKNPKKYFK